MADPLPCFKAYDIRGKVSAELNEEVAWRIGRACAAELRPAGPVAVGHDIRRSSPALAKALIGGLCEGGAVVLDIGRCGTEMVYFAAARPGAGGGIMVTASHNPKEYNGMKLVRAGAIPISGPTGLDAIARRLRNRRFGRPAARPGQVRRENLLAPYLDKLLSFVAPSHLRPLRIVVNPGNGGAGPVVDALARRLPFRLHRVHFRPDGTFPHGVPNPMLPENRTATARAVRRHHADLGVAWDGDFDRCFLFDEHGDFIEGYYIVGLLAAQMLRSHPGAAVIHDPRLTWNTLERVRAAGGVAVECRTGHTFMKEGMRAHDAVYGGELSSHHYFRDFAYCDSGMIPWLLVAALLCEGAKPLSELVAECRRRFPASGEINRTVADPGAAMARVRRHYRRLAERTSTLDGLSMEFAEGWRFNLRTSQTEPLLRLNVEARDDAPLMRQRTAELLELIGGEPPRK